MSDVDYEALKADFERGRLDEVGLAAQIIDEWAAAYRARASGETELVEITLGAVTYLFDVAAERVIAVYGHSVLTQLPRPAGRMRGFPLPTTVPGPFVRGHLVAHAIGGGTDINLVPQSATLNVSGPWRRLERLAQAHPGAFVAVEVGYADASQTPSRFTYLVAVECALSVEQFANR